ncbi:MAG: alpha/beta hydrolase [Pseudomonadota bacterium]
MSGVTSNVSPEKVRSVFKNGGQLDTPYTRAIAAPEDERTWVVFSHVRIPAESFAQSRVFELLGGAKIHFNALANDWYGGGIPGVGSTYTEVTAWLSTALADRDPRQVTFVGHSMGAHAALVFSDRFPASHFLATSPELTLAQPGSRSRDNGVSLSHPKVDLYRSISPRNRTKQGMTIFGSYDAVDAGYLAQSRTYSGRFGKIYVAPYHHGVTEYLTHNRFYLSLLENRQAYADALMAKGGISGAPDDLTRQRLWTFAELYREWETGQMVRALRLAKVNENWDHAGWQSLVATVLSRAGANDAALGRARRAARLEPQIAEYLLLYAKLANAARSLTCLNEAEALMRAMVRPHRAVRSYLEKGDRKAPFRLNFARR